MTLALLAIAMAAAPVEVWLDVDGAPCVTHERLQRALEQRGHRVVTAREASTMQVTATGSASQLMVSATRGAQRFERAVPVASGDCEAVMRVTIALVTSWASARPPRVRDAGAAPATVEGTGVALSGAEPGGQSNAVDATTRSPQTGTEVSASPDAAARGQKSVRGAGNDGTANASTAAAREVSARATARDVAANENTDAASNDAATSVAAREMAAGAAQNADGAPTPLGAAQPDVLGGETASDTRAPDGIIAANPVAPARAGDASSMLSLDVIALGGVQNEPLTGTTTGLGQLGVRGALGRFGLLLDGGFDSERTATREGITARASTQWLSLSLSVAFHPLEKLSLDVALGARGWRMAGWAVGLDGSQTQTFFTAGGVLSAGVNYHLTGPLHLQLRPWLSLRGQRAHFTVSPLGTILPVEPLAWGALLGAMVRFD